MKKFLIFLLLVLLALIINVNYVLAETSNELLTGDEFDELDCKDKIKLIETSLSGPVPIQAYMPICKKSDEYSFLTVNEHDKFVGQYAGKAKDWRNFDFVKTVGNIRQKVYAYRDDNKGFAPPREAPLCIEASARVWPYTKCDWTEWTKSICHGCDFPCGTEEKPMTCHDDCCTETCPDSSGGPPWSGPSNGKCARRWADPKWPIYEYKPAKVPGNVQLIPPTEAWNNKKAETKTLADGKKQCDKDMASALGSPSCSCHKKYVRYEFLCPQYTCVLKPIITGICTPTFRSDDSGHKYNFYCINPSQPFTPTFTEEGEFIRDKEINPKNCENSFSTLDCGFANILIEAEYYNRITVPELAKDGIKKDKIPEKIIEFAMRLWSEHNNQQGFKRMSISNKQINPSNGKCDKNVYYMMVNNYTEYVNIYKETRLYFFEKILKTITDDDNQREIDISNQDDLDLFKYTCDEKILGVACEPGPSATSVLDKTQSKYYKIAYALVANTILGNDYMQEHLNELFKDEVSDKIRKVSIIKELSSHLTSDGSDNNNQFVEVIFEDLGRVLNEYEIKDKKIMCTEENFKKYPKIKPYCQLEIHIVDSEGKIIKINGKELIESDKAASYCTKNYCRFKTISFAICDEKFKNYAPIKVKIKRNKPKSTDSISKYVSCSDPTDNQIMYGFDDGKDEHYPGSNIPRPGEKEQIEDIFTLSDYKCEGVCNDYFPREKLKQKCEDKFTEYDKVYTTTIKDPSLRCILNMGDSSAKNLYNYSEEFGLIGTDNTHINVNNKFCKIYCSDEVEYHLADKVREKAGRVFKFDIENQVRNERNVKYKFSNIIRLKRTCVSEIYYDNIKIPDSYDWKTIYDLGKTNINKELGLTESRINELTITDKEIDEINNWTSLFKVLVKKSQTEGARDENINKIIYDLMNCNLYSDKDIKKLGITRPQDDKVGNIRDLIVNHFIKDNNYGIGTDNYGTKIKKGIKDDSLYCNIKTKEGSSKPECIMMHTIDYKYGKNNHQVTNVDMQSVVTNRNSFEQLTYCTNTETEECFKWEDDMLDDKIKYDESGKEIEKSNSEYNYPISKDYLDNKTTKIEYFVRKGKDLSKTNAIEKKTVQIPTNDYVMFEIQTDFAFYNNSRFEVDPNGESYIRTQSEIDSKDKSKEKDSVPMLLISPYLFPISRNAYNSSECSDRDFLNPDHSEGKAAKDAGYPIARRCNLKQLFTNFNLYFRKDSSDLFSIDASKIAKEDGFLCYVDVEMPSPVPPGPDTRDSVLYRNIDPENVFPSSKDGYSDIFKSNWNSVLGRKTTDKVKKSANELKTTENYLEYRITLTPDDILNIRNYDKTAGKYVDEKQNACIKLPYNKEQEGAYEGAYDDIEKEEDPDNTQQYDVFYKCKSPFMDILRNSTEYGTIDPEFNGLQEKLVDKEGKD